MHFNSTNVKSKTKDTFKLNVMLMIVLNEKLESPQLSEGQS